MTTPCAPPNVALTTAPTKAKLDAYLGKNIDAICGNGYENDLDNHCAHFVSHAMAFTFGYTCKHMTGKGTTGYCIRVHEVFAQCGAVGKWANRAGSSCLVFITAAKNVDLAKKAMTNVPRKHVGIYLDGAIWHYSNIQDKVVTQTPEEFSHHYKEGSMFFGTFPL